MLKSRDVFVTSVGGYVRGVCERQASKKCAVWVIEFREAFNLTLDLTGKVSAGSALVDTGFAVLRNGRRSTLLVPEYDMEAVRANYFVNSDERIANPLIGINANSGTPALAHRYRLKGVRGREFNRTRDYDIYHF